MLVQIFGFIMGMFKKIIEKNYIRKKKMPKYEQPFLDGFLEAEAETREKMIDETTRQIHLARQFIRFDKMQRLATSDRMKKMAEKAKMETIKLMQRV